MNLEYFIAKKITKGAQNRRLSKPIVQIALGGIILGMAVMILTIFIVKGFQQEVSNRTIAFGAHIQILKFTNNNSFEPQPLYEHQDFLKELQNDDRIAHIQQFATKNGIIKTKIENEGVVVKGVGADYDFGFIGKHIIEGKAFDPAGKYEKRPALISKILSDRLGLNVGDRMVIYFLITNKKEMQIRSKENDSIIKTITFYTQEAEDSIRNSIPLNEVSGMENDTDIIAVPDVSKKEFTVSGLYESGMEEFDKKTVFVQLDVLKKVNHWNENQTGGFEIYVKDFKKVDEIGKEVYDLVGGGITSQTIKESNPSIFTWLDMHEQTAWIILILMVIVSVINMVSALIILIIEKTNMIGILKALGMDNGRVKKIFMVQAGGLIAKGMFWGNVFGLGLAVIQNYFHLFKLDQATYYISFIPIKFEWFYLILLNLGTFGICILFMLLPAIIISRTTPIKAIRFD